MIIYVWIECDFVHRPWLVETKESSLNIVIVYFNSYNVANQLPKKNVKLK